MAPFQRGFIYLWAFFQSNLIQHTSRTRRLWVFWCLGLIAKAFCCCAALETLSQKPHNASFTKIFNIFVSFFRSNWKQISSTSQLWESYASVCSRKHFVAARRLETTGKKHKIAQFQRIFINLWVFPKQSDTTFSRTSQLWELVLDGW